MTRKAQNKAKFCNEYMCVNSKLAYVTLFSYVYTNSNSNSTNQKFIQESDQRNVMGSNR